MQNNIRVFYQKLSRAKYISHLDITRCMQRAIKRADIPVWYTEGFNPHIYLTFALPLALGYESLFESMDLRLVEEYDLEKLKERFNEVLPPDIRVTKITEQVNKPERITHSLYKLVLSCKTVNGEKLLALFEEFMGQDEINVKKKSKRGIKTIDIKPDCEVVKAYAGINALGESALVLRVKTAAGNEKNINPTLLTDEFFKQNDIDDFACDVLREEVYMDDGSLFE